MPLPEPPAMGQTMLPPGTFDGTTVIVTGGGTGLGKAIAVEFARLGRGGGDPVARRRATAWPAWPPSKPSGAGPPTPVPTSASAEDIATAFDALEGALGPAACPRQQRCGQLPRPRRGPESQRLAGGDPDRARRHLLLFPGAVPPGSRARASRPPSATSWPPSPSRVVRAWPTPRRRRRAWAT